MLLLPIYILSDAIGVYLYRKQYSKENLRILIPPAIAGVVIGWLTAALISESAVSAIIGWMGILFCLNLWYKQRFSEARLTEPTPSSKTKGTLWGTLSGFTSFISHAGAPPYQIYILPQQLPKMVFAGTTTILFAVVNLAKVVPYCLLQPYTWHSFFIALILLPFAALGTVAGKLLIQGLNDKFFYLLVQIALFAISLKLVFNSFA